MRQTEDHGLDRHSRGGHSQIHVKADIETGSVRYWACAEA
jgi:hypothetical protein